MEALIRVTKIVGSWLAAIAIVLGLSYWSERPKYHFEEVAKRVGQQMPGARLILSAKSGDLVSPVSWFWTATTTFNFAMPDLSAGRFYVMTLRFDEKEPAVYLIDADCENRKVEWFGLDEPESAYPARDVFGEAVRAPNGKTYRRSRAQLAAPPQWLHAFCDTDWTPERKAVVAARQAQRNGN